MRANDSLILRALVRSIRNTLDRWEARLLRRAASAFREEGTPMGSRDAAGLDAAAAALEKKLGER